VRDKAVAVVALREGIGSSARRIDGEPKVRGSYLYAATSRPTG
jgi:hypothetical protein